MLNFLKSDQKLPHAQCTPIADRSAVKLPVNFDDPNYPCAVALQEATEYLRRIPKNGYVPVSDLLRLKFYSLYKQATEGDLDESKVKQPSMLRDWEGYWKYVGWRQVRGMSREDACDTYVSLFESNTRQRSSFRWAPPKDRWEALAEADQYIRKFPKHPVCLPEELRARYYGLYKQATVGDLKKFVRSPVVAKEKKYKWLRAGRPAKEGYDQMRYDAWLSHEGMSCDAAMRLYLREFWIDSFSYGYEWHPPGHPKHMAVVGNQHTEEDRLKMSQAAAAAANKLAVTAESTCSEENGMSRTVTADNSLVVK